MIQGERIAALALCTGLALAVTMAGGVAGEKSPGRKGADKKTTADRKAQEDADREARWKSAVWSHGDSSADAFVFDLLFVVNAYDPEFNVKERMAKLLAQSSTTTEEIKEALRNYRDLDYGLLYRYEAAVDDLFSSFRDDQGYNLGARHSEYPTLRAEHQANLKRIDQHLARKSPRAAANAIFDQFELDDDHPLAKRQPKAFLRELAEARDAAAAYYDPLSIQAGSGRGRPQLDKNTDALKREVMELWKRHPAAAYPINAGILPPESRRRGREADYQAARGVYSRVREMDRLTAERTPAEVIRLLRHRAETEAIFPELMQMLDKAYGMEKKGGFSAADVKRLFQDHFETRTRQLKQSAERNKSRAQAMDRNAEILRKENETVAQMLEGQPPEVAVRRLQGWLLKRMLHWYNLRNLAAADLVTGYQAGRTEYPELLDELAADPGLAMEKLRERVLAYWDRNPVAGVAFGVKLPASGDDKDASGRENKTAPQ